MHAAAESTLRILIRRRNSPALLRDETRWLIREAIARIHAEGRPRRVAASRWMPGQARHDIYASNPCGSITNFFGAPASNSP